LIIADVHEPDRLKALADEVRSLPVDYIIVGSERKYMVERKEVMDLWKSVQDGRFWKQMAYMEEARESEGYIPILLIEGSLFKLFKFAEGMRPRNFMGIQVALSSFGVTVVQLPSRMVPDFLIFLNEKADKKRTFARPNIPKPIERTLDEERIDVLRAIRGIGEKTAVELLQAFGSVKGVIDAEYPALRAILGKKADHFVEVVRGRFGGESSLSVGVSEGDKEDELEG
jgi:ERCC4-type nuclease